MLGSGGDQEQLSSFWYWIPCAGAVLLRWRTPERAQKVVCTQNDKWNNGDIIRLKGSVV